MNELRRRVLQAFAALGVLPTAGFDPARAARPLAPQRMVDVGLPYVMMHVEGGKGCGKPAAYMVEYPGYCTAIRSATFRRLDGSLFGVGSEQSCGTCGTHFAVVRHGIYTSESPPRPAPVPWVHA